MADHSKILKFIENSQDRDGLRRLVRRAREQGAKEVQEAAFRKLISLVPEVKPGTLEHDFWTTVYAFEHILSEERNKTTRLSRTRQKVDRVGVMDTLTDWAYGKQTEGFDMLIERGMPELTGEAIVVRHADRFPDEVVAAARARLVDVGYEPPERPAARTHLVNARGIGSVERAFQRASTSLPYDNGLRSLAYRIAWSGLLVWCVDQPGPQGKSCL